MTAQASKQNVCPIPGCNFHYATAAKTGWYKHVTGPAMHPHWYPEIKEPESRALLFRQEFPNFLPASGQFSKLTPDLGAIEALVKDFEALRDRIRALAPGKEKKTGT